VLLVISVEIHYKLQVLYDKVLGKMLEPNGIKEDRFRAVKNKLGAFNVGNVARMLDTINAYVIWVQNIFGKRPVAIK
jgi:hypothetical protein